MLGPSWNGCYGLNYGLPFVPPYYLYHARSPPSHLLGEIVNLLLLDGISLFFSTGFLYFTGNFQSQHGVGEAAQESSWDVLRGRTNVLVIPADNGTCWSVSPRQRGSSSRLQCSRHTPSALWAPPPATSMLSVSG